MTEHVHQWAADKFHAGIGCTICSCSGWDWATDRIRDLTADLKLANDGLEQARQTIRKLSGAR